MFNVYAFDMNTDLFCLQSILTQIIFTWPFLNVGSWYLFVIINMGENDYWFFMSFVVSKLYIIVTNQRVLNWDSPKKFLFEYLYTYNTTGIYTKFSCMYQRLQFLL